MNKLNIFCMLLIGISCIIHTGSSAQAANLLNDPGFESSSPDGSFPNSGHWNSAWLGEAGAGCTTTAAHSGTAGLWEYTGTATTDWWAGPFQDDITANEGEIFIGSAWVRSHSFWVSGSQALVRLTFLDKAKTPLASKDSLAITSAESGWQQLSVQTAPAPAGTAYVKYTLYLEKTSGTAGQSIALFDDCTLERSTQPVLSISPITLGFGADRTSLTFDIQNSGNDVLSWAIAKNVSWATLSATSGTTTTETDTVTVTISRTGLHLSAFEGVLSVTSNGGNQEIHILIEVAPSREVPELPAIVSSEGYRLMVQRRFYDGTLDIPRPYTIKGAAWSPASIGTLSDVTS
nr:hypothetical protein [uncultured Desulfobulbus sp.]